MFGDRAFELLKEVERNSDRLLTFDENGLRNIFEEMGALRDQNQYDIDSQRDAQQEITYSAGFMLRHYALERNKKCILAYIYQRLMQVQDIRWMHGSVLPPQIRLNMTEQEVQFFNNYNKVLANYMRSIGENTGLDLTMDTDPPKRLMIEVKVVQDYGEFETPDGDIIVLKKDSIHYLAKSQCESLIRQGVLVPTG